MAVPNLDLPLDKTGVLAGNRLSSTESISTAAKMFAAPNGPFFTFNMELRRSSNNALLSPGIDYRPLNYDPDASLEVGREVCSVIQIINSALTEDVIFTANYVGGPFSVHYYAIQQWVDALANDDHRFYWGQILDKPSFFPPTTHLQSIYSTYGFDALVAAQLSIRDAILVSNEAEMGAMYNYINTRILNDTAKPSDITNLQTAIAQAIANHKAESSAHSPANVGLGLLNNWQAGSSAEHIAGTSNRYATCAGLKAALDNALSGLSGSSFTALQTAFNNHTNSVAEAKHTAAQVGLGLVVNQGQASLAQAQSGTTTHYINTIILSQMLAALTKASVGLANVDNTSDLNKPVSTAVSNALVAKADKTTTITGAGLAQGGGDLAGNRVITVPKATSVEAQTGTDDTKALTPLTGAALVAAKAVAADKQINVAGLAQGGGLLTGSPTINVPKATNMDVAGGTDDSKALTVLTGKLVVETYGAKASNVIQTSGLATGGGQTLGSATITIGVPKASNADAQSGALDTVALTPVSGKASVLQFGAAPQFGVDFSILVSGTGVTCKPNQSGYVYVKQLGYNVPMPTVSMPFNTLFPSLVNNTIYFVFMLYNTSTSSWTLYAVPGTSGTRQFSDVSTYLTKSLGVYWDVGNVNGMFVGAFISNYVSGSESGDCWRSAQTMGSSAAGAMSQHVAITRGHFNNTGAPTTLTMTVGVPGPLSVPFTQVIGVGTNMQRWVLVMPGDYVEYELSTMQSMMMAVSNVSGYSAYGAISLDGVELISPSVSHLSPVNTYTVLATTTGRRFKMYERLPMLGIGSVDSKAISFSKGAFTNGATLTIVGDSPSGTRNYEPTVESRVTVVGNAFWGA